MKPVLTFLGVGGAFAPLSKGNSVMMVTSGESRFLIDCGSSLQYTLKDRYNLTPLDIDGIWITHAHADHIGSLEWFAFYRYFMPKKDKDGNVVKPKLYTVPSLMKELWQNSLKGGLQRINGLNTPNNIPNCSFL